MDVKFSKSQKPNTFAENIEVIDKMILLWRLISYVTGQTVPNSYILYYKTNVHHSSTKSPVGSWVWHSSAPACYNLFYLFPYWSMFSSSIYIFHSCRGKQYFWINASKFYLGLIQVEQLLTINHWIPPREKCQSFEQEEINLLYSRNVNKRLVSCVTFIHMRVLWS